MKAAKILNTIFLSIILTTNLVAGALTITVSEKIPLDAAQIRAALEAKDPKTGALDAEILVYGYSTGKTVYRLSKEGDLNLNEENGEVTAMIKFRGKNRSKKPIFVKGKGLFPGVLSESLVEELYKALLPHIK